MRLIKGSIVTRITIIFMIIIMMMTIIKEEFDTGSLEFKLLFSSPQISLKIST